MLLLRYRVRGFGVRQSTVFTASEEVLALALTASRQFIVGGPPGDLYFVNEYSELQYAAGTFFVNERPLDVLVAEELFGVSHPDQILTFPTFGIDPASYKIIDQGEMEVAYQQADEGLLVRLTDGLAANGSRSWYIRSGARSAPAQVSVTDQGTYWLMDNGIVACRIAKAATVFGAPQWEDAFAAEIKWDGGGVGVDNPLPDIPAPIQGVRHMDGTWTGTGSQINLLCHYWRRFLPGTGTAGAVQAFHPYPALTMTVTVLESGPLRARIRVTYTGPRPDWVGGVGGLVTYDGHATNGTYISTITLEAGQRVIKVTDESDMTPSYKIPMNTGVSADRCRMMGQNCTLAVYGHYANGDLYSFPHAAPRGQGGDAALDYEAEWDIADISQEVGPTRTASTYPTLSNWWDFVANAGIYYYFFNNAASTGNIWGIIQGPASELTTGSRGNAMVGLYTDGAGQSGIHKKHEVFGPDQTSQLYRTQPYFIFLGTKEDDVPAVFSTPSGAWLALNLHTGTAQLRKQINQGLEFPDPSEGWSGLYLTRDETIAKILAIRDDPDDESGSGPYGRAWQDDVGYRDLWTALRDGTNAEAGDLADDLHDEMNYVIDKFTNTGHYRYIQLGYWHGSERFQDIAVRATSLLTLDEISPFLTTEKKRKLKAVMAAAGHIIWDNDFTPANSTSFDSFSFGTANMPGQYAGHLYMFGALLKEHSQFIARYSTVIQGAKDLFNGFVNSDGASKESPHYTGTITPSTDLLRQLQVAGLYDAFDSGSELYAKLVLFGEFCMQLLTPPQSRFGDRRKMVCFGDGSSEGMDHYLSLIMGFRTSNPTLSARMMDSWDSQDRPLISFYGSSTLKIDEDITPQGAALADADFPGYMTVMRSAWNTANESAVFVCHGDWYTDHANFERGAVGIYLLGDPISIIFGSFGTPHIDNPYSWNSYVATSELGGTWTAITDVDITCGDFSDLYPDTYVWTTNANVADLEMEFTLDAGTWDRTVTLYRDDTTMPVVRIRDDTSYAGDHVFSLPIMASGAYTKPDLTTATPTTLEGTSYAIANGACFKFTGQWGTSVDVYYFGPSADAFVGIYSHSWHPSVEEAQYTAAVGGSFAEMQYMLRIKTAGPCDIAIVPYPTGSRPTNLAVTQGASKLVVTASSPSINRDLPD